MIDGNHKRRKSSVNCPVPLKVVKEEDIVVLRYREVFARNVNRLLSTCSLVIIRGPLFCGKSYCAKKAAKLCQSSLNVVQVNEDFDVKTLFGSYKCMDVPGEFVWTPSPFAKFLQTDGYILLEELDTGSPDLVAAILTLSEKREYTLYSGEQCSMHKNCRIVATVTSGRDTSLNLIRDYPFFVEIPLFNQAELSSVCAIQFPGVKSITEKLLHIFEEVCCFTIAKCSSDRQLNAKDFFRLCRRLNTKTDFSDNISLFKELSDVLIMHLSDKKCRFEIALKIGSQLSIAFEQIKTILDVQKPELSADDEFVKIGRVKLLRKKDFFVKTHSFGLTRECCQLMERIAVSISSASEPVLLTGETGVGKTSVVQLLADYCGINLKIVNMSQDSEFADLVGGFKPTPIMHLMQPLCTEYIQFFRKTFSEQKNSKFISRIKKCLENEQVEDFLKVVIQTGSQAARIKTSFEWANLVIRAKRLLHYVQSSSCAFPFTFVAGIVAKATKFGHWLLIDEINLAPSDCLDAIMQVIDASTGVHPNFRIFACMNPATDIGKCFLSVNVRSRFTEFFVSEPTEKEQLEVIVKNYLPEVDLMSIDSILNFYQDVQTTFPKKFSLRTLCRALIVIANNKKVKDQRKFFALGFLISFTSNLDAEEQVKLGLSINKHFGKIVDLKSFTPALSDLKNFVEVEGSYIKKGKAQVYIDEHFIFTPSVKSNLAFLASIVANSDFPILLEGETSAGKTSMIQYLAKVTGNCVYRINNHEHTDIQEYIGSYSPNASGHIEFIEGVLLKAVRNGDWIILDELNLAPSIVLEALNRLLDDNREIYVPELNFTVAAHAHFRLFATQNPAGHYAGRKRLSAAFLNRFVIIKYDHLPFEELPKIVQGRCGVAPSVSKKMVEVLIDLKSRRSVNGIFSFSNGLMTLRDLFRWGTRVASAMRENCDWRQIAVDQGYFVLASRCRSSDDEKMVIGILEKCLKRKVNLLELFGLTSKFLPKFIVEKAENGHVVLTFSMRRMIVLCLEAWKFNEAVLLVGETGCGKTTVAHLLDAIMSINCHERTETSDFLGNIRPTSDNKFQWNDGIVIQAMKQGKKLLIDEISLAPDSVLERLNSLLETDRSILLTDGVAESITVVAHDSFKIIATMNPGDDHGKKELSKALRNRFLEIWCSGEQLRDEMQTIIEKRMRVDCTDLDLIKNASTCFIMFFEYFRKNYSHIFKTVLTIRDLINMSELFSSCRALNISPSDSFYHSISANLFDSFGVVPSRVSFNRNQLIKECLTELKRLLSLCHLGELQFDKFLNSHVDFKSNGLYVAQFFIPFGDLNRNLSAFLFDAPTSSLNLLCVARGMASTKPIMLEGSPGAGKSSLIVALAEVTGNSLVRLNLSEQTDLHDLFGGDYPIITDEGKTSFTWQDGPVLKAIKDGSWILLDEMNLASQSVLEGLNSCFDFRKTLYITELNKIFEIKSNKCRFFACQNPRSQGGDRKALPKSFLNRFTSIYVNEMSDSDFLYVLQKNYGTKLTNETLSNMVTINRRILQLSVIDGGPFEFNLRDLLRWAFSIEKFGVIFGFKLVYVSRLRNTNDINAFHNIFYEVFWEEKCLPLIELPSVFENRISCGNFSISLENSFFNDVVLAQTLSAFNFQIEALHKISSCIDLEWLSLLVGNFSSGMRSTIEALATLAGKKLHVLRLTLETDSLELLGSYEQIVETVSFVEFQGNFIEILEKIISEDQKVSRKLLLLASNCSTIDELRCLVQQVLVIHSNEELEKLSGQLSRTTNARFQWIDSNFVNAYKNGYWILLQDVNCCSSAVLDCLNSCLEDGGNLMIPGHSGSKSTIINKHSNFRAFFTMDPRNGSLSRAMRNRCVEIYFGNKSFWKSTLKPFFIDNFLSEKVDENVLNWILSTTLGESLKLKAFECKQNDIIEIMPLTKLLCEKIIVPEKIFKLFKTSGEFSEMNYFNSVIQFGLCFPFSSENDLFLFKNDDIKWISNPSKHEKNNSQFWNLLSDFNGFFSSLYALLGKQSDPKLYCETDLPSLHSLPWINDCTKNIFSSLEAFNFSFSLGGSRESMLCFLNSPYVTFLANKLWNIFGFTITPEWAQIKDFSQSTLYLKRLRNAFWKLTFLKSEIRHGVKNKLKQIGDRFYFKNFSSCFENSFAELFSLINSSVTLLKALTPQRNSPDTAGEIFIDLKSKNECEKLRVVCAFFRCLKNFLAFTAEGYNDSFFENLKYPILQLLWKPYKSTSFEEQTHEKNVTDDFQSLSVYRPTDLAFCQLSNFLNEFVQSIKSFDATVLKSNITRLLIDGRSNISTASLLLVSSQIESFLKTCAFFKNKLLKKFIGYPDISLTFAGILNVLTIGLNCLIKKILSIQNHVEIFEKYNFPKINNDIWNLPGLEIIVQWALGKDSILPLKLQLDIVNWQFAKTDRSNFDLCVKWVFKIWSSRYEKTLQKKSEMYVYKSRANNISDNLDEIPDEDKIEFDFYFPDYSNVDFDDDDVEKSDVKFQIFIPQDYNYVSDKELVDLLHQIANPNKNESEQIEFPYFLSMKLINELNLYDFVKEQNCNFLQYQNLIYFRKADFFLSKMQKKQSERILNVYTETDYSETCRCVEAVGKLKQKIATFYDEFPENQILSTILNVIERFLEMPTTMPLMRLTALLEKLLVEATQWQQLADRAHSIQNELLVLQNILVDWRRFEVLCWSDIITRIENESRQTAVICSFPLFEAFEKLWDDESFEMTDRENKIIVMLIDWIQNASLVDYNVRLFSGKLLAQYVTYKVKNSTTSRISANLSSRIFLIVNYFNIFESSLNERFNNTKKEVEEKLKNFVEIFKYNDLNLWSVKDSTQKVHAQLFRIIRKFKDICREPIINVLFGDLLSIESFKDFKNIEFQNESIESNKLFLKINCATEKMNHFLFKCTEIETLTDLQDLAETLLATLKTDILYSGTDEEKEKQQGRALFERQKQFSFLIRSLAGIGLGSRCGLQVDSELLTITSMSTVNLDAIPRDEVQKLIRHSISSRNIFLKKITVLRLNQNDHIRKQVPMSMFSHLRGITEYGLYWTVNAAQYLIDDLFGYVEKFDRFAENFTIIGNNFKDNYTINNTQIDEFICNSKFSLTRMLSLIRLLSEVIQSCPDSTNESGDLDYLHNLSVDIENNSLVQLKKSSQSYNELLLSFTSAKNLLCEAYAKLVSVQSSSQQIYKADEILTLKDVIRTQTQLFRQTVLPTFSDFFDNEYKELDLLSQLLIENTDKIKLTNALTVPITFDDTTMVLLKIQQIFKGMNSKADNATKATKLMDLIKELIGLMSRIDLKETVEKFANFLEHFSTKAPHYSSSLEDIKSAQVLSTGFSMFLKCISDHLLQFLQHFSVCYLQFEAIAFQIVSNGFVNAISKADGSTSKGKDGDAMAGENLGMGDSDNVDGAGDATDVSNEIDNIGQIEGLQDEEKKNEKDKDEKPNESEQPIEMDDDFAGGLEDLDAEEVNENEDKNSDPNNETGLDDKIDWEKGDVNEPEERQLDPELWDKPLDKEEPEAVDGDNADAADKETGELTAKDSESVPIPEDNQNSNETDTLTEDLPEKDGSMQEKNDEDEEVEMNDCTQLDNNDESNCEQGQPDSEEIDNDSNFDNAESMEDDKTKEENSVENEVKSKEKDAMGLGKPDEKDDKQKSGQSDQTEIPDNEKERDDDFDTIPNDDDSCIQNSNLNESLKTQSKREENRNEKSNAKNKTDDKTEKVESERQKGELADEDMENASELKNEEAMEICEEDEDEEDGDEKFSADKEQSHRAQSKLIVQNSTLEEASRTKELYRKYKESSEKVCHEPTKEIVLPETDGPELLEFNKLFDDSIIVISQTLNSSYDSAQMSFVNKGLEDLSTFDNNDSRNQILEMRWSTITNTVSQLASMLAENLRIIIEPSVASRLQGDYRTGKRLNVRRLISYIASDYRKDRIWMRRTKKLKRNYHICIAVDDSASMKDNLMTTITCHSLCLIEKALRQLEVGKLMICKFGRSVKVLSDFCATAENISESGLGARLINELTFMQDKTDLANLLNVVADKFVEVQRTFTTGSSVDQMLIILSDGRGVMADGLERVKRLIKRLEFQQITVLFLIIDDSEKSIMDIKVAQFGNDGSVKLTSYMEQFPFPFYAIINGISQLPSAISHAIQQWFEFTSR